MKIKLSHISKTKSAPECSNKVLNEHASCQNLRQQRQNRYVVNSQYLVSLVGGGGGSPRSEDNGSDTF